VILYIVALFNAYDWYSYALVLAVTLPMHMRLAHKAKDHPAGLKPLISSSCSRRC
jgi:hypothetical protein